MNTRKPLALLLASILLSSSCAAAPVAPSAAQGEEPETELGGHMEEISGAWRKVRRQVSDPASNGATLELVGTMRKNAVAALELAPVRMEDVPEADRPAFLAAYHREMKAFVDLLGKLESALKEGRNADAEKLVADIGAHQRASHKEFKRPDKDAPPGPRQAAGGPRPAGGS